MSGHVLGRALFALKIALSNIEFLGYTTVNIPNDITIGSPAFARLTVYLFILKLSQHVCKNTRTSKQTHAHESDTPWPNDTNRR